MPEASEAGRPQRLPVGSGPKCQTSTVSLLSSMVAMFWNPTWLAAPVVGSQIALRVKLRSLVVRGWPSDHLRPDFSLIVMSMWVASIDLTSPLATLGTSLTRSGIGLFRPSKAHSDDHIGPSATWRTVWAVSEITFRSETDSQSEKTSCPPFTPATGL